MCIRDSHNPALAADTTQLYSPFTHKFWTGGACEPINDNYACLLYTSDAADERSSVDLGGRRIIKKKTIVLRYGMHCHTVNKITKPQITTYKQKQK